MKKSPPKISVVIPVYNRTECLRECLQGLLQQTMRSELQIIIVDDASTQRGPKELAEAFCATYYRNKERFGSGYCKNIGLTNTDCEYVLFVDSDVRFISKTSIETAINAFSSLQNCGEVGGEALIDSHNHVMYVFGRNIDLRTGKSTCDYVPVNSDMNPNKFWVFDYIPTSNCMLRREIALKLRGFDDAYRCLGEDKEFGYRVSQLGLQNFVLKDSVVLHKFVKEGRNSSGLQKQYRTQIRFYWRHFGFRETVNMGYRFSKTLLRDQFCPANQMNHVDNVLTEFGKYYRKEILGFTASEPSSQLSRIKEVSTSISIFGSAFFWNLAHRRGLDLEGSNRLEI